MNSSYKQQLEQMVQKIDILTRLRIVQARDWNAPWFEGKHYYAMQTPKNKA